MPSIVTVLTVAVALAGAALLPCQQDLPSPERVVRATKQEPEAGKKAPFVFEAGTVPLLELIDRCSAYLQYNIQVDASELQVVASGRGGAARARGRAPAAAAEPKEEDLGPIISLQLPVVTDHNGCEELLTSMLWSNGLALVALDHQKSVYEVLAMEGRRAREIFACAVRRSPEEVLARPMLRTMALTVVTLKHINAQLANNALRPFFASSGNSHPGTTLMIVNVGNKSSLILTGPQFMVASAVQLLLEADVPETELPQLLETRFEELAQQNKVLMQRLADLEKRLSGK